MKSWDKATRGLCKYLLGCCLALCATGATRARASTLYAIRGAAQNELVRFDSGSPNMVSSIGTISGLPAGAGILGMDYSPFLGGVYAVTSSRLYKINLDTAQAQPVGPAAFTPPITGGAVDFECDRTGAQARIVSSSYNGRIDLSNGAYIGSGTAPGTSINGLAQALSGPANGFYGIDFSSNTLRLFADINTGASTPIGSGLGVSGLQPSFGFDIAPDGVAYLSYLIGATSNFSNLFTVNLSTGAASLVGLIGDGAGNISSLTAIVPAGQSAIIINEVGPASPYPSTMTVEGYANIPLSRVRVRLNGLSHTFPDDIRVLLVGPGGQSAVLMANAGSTPPTGGNPVSNIDLLFDDGAANVLPDTTQITAGAYKPTAYDDGLSLSLPAPAPPAPYTASLGVFNGTDPNGVWKLFVQDDLNGDFGQIANGWSLLLDQAPSIYNVSGAAYVFSESAGVVSVVIRRTGNTAGPGSVAYALSAASADASDFVASSGVVSFAPGETEKSVPITILNDEVAEPNEFFTISLSTDTSSGFAGQIGSPASSPIVIANDDAVPVITVAPATIAEGQPGTNPAATFNATLDKPALGPVTFTYTASTTTGDFVVGSGQATFAAGATSTWFVLNSIGDAKVEGDESFVVQFSNPLGATLAAPTTTLTLLNDDLSIPVITVSSPTINEGAPGINAPAVFTVTLDKPAFEPITFAYSAQDTTGDFVSESGTATVAAGEITTSFSIAALGDSVLEPNESFSVALSNAVGGTLASATATLTLANDDAPPAAQPVLSVENKQVAEGAPGQIKNVVFTAKLSAPSAFPVVFTYTVGAGLGPDKATAGEDFIASTGTVYFAPGVTSRNFSVSILGDSKVEKTEEARVALSELVNATLVEAQPGVFLNGARLLITNDDVPIKITSVSPLAGKVGTTVTIKGTGFIGAKVFFNGKSSFVPAVIKSATATQIVTSVPPGARTGIVRVDGAGNGVAIFSDPLFKVLPTIFSALLTSGPAGMVFYITGDSLDTVTGVKVGGAVAPFASLSPTLLRITIPARASSGAIVLTSPGGVVASTFRFNVLPLVTSFSPARASAGARVIITGSGLLGARQVLFGTTRAAFAVNSATQITATVPAGASSGPITVITAAGRAASRTLFAVLLSAGSFSPTRGPIGTAVAIQGSGFVGVRSVFFNNVAATSFRVVSASQIIATVPAGATTGRIRVLSTANGEATTLGVFTVASAAAG